MQVIAVRSEVVVDDIDEDHQAERVRRVDQLLEFIRRAVGRVRRIRQHPVVAPVARTREVIEWHQFDSGDAELDERRQTLDHAQETAAGTDMQFVQPGFVPWPSPPVRGWPREIGRASCRERVCQYVWIWGVGVSLK